MLLLLLLLLLLLQGSSPRQQVARAGNFMSELLPTFELSKALLFACAAAAAYKHRLSRRLEQLRYRLGYQTTCHLLWKLVLLPDLIGIFDQLLAPSLLTLAKGTGRPLSQAYFQQRM